MSKLHLKIKNIILLWLCFFKFLREGKSDKEIKELKKVAVVQLAKLGDMVCVTPMFRAIKNKYPECKVYVVGDAVNKKLLENSLDVDNYLVYQKNVFEVVRELKKAEIDFGCITGPSPEGLAMLYLSEIPRIAAPVIENGFSPQETRVYKIIRKFVIPVPHRMRHYAAREYLRLLEQIGIYADDIKKHLGFSEEAGRRMQDFFQEKNVDADKDFIVGIFPSTGYKIKRWPSDRFAKLADYIYQKYNAKIIIPGGEHDRQEIEEMIRKLDPNTKIFNTLNLFNVDEFKALISKLHLLIAVDTGPLYVAEAFGVPTIDIIGPMDEVEQSPRGSYARNVIARKSGEKPELFVMNNRLYNEKEARRQVEDITVKVVIEAVDELVQRINLA